MTLPVPRNIVETPGEGVEGSIDGRKAAVGGIGFVTGRVDRGEPGAVSRDSGQEPGAVVVALGVDGKMAGELVMADALRSGIAKFLKEVRPEGVDRILLATGDRRAVADAVSEGLGLDGVRADLTPDQKVLLVLSERKNGPVMMVGDGRQRCAGAGGGRYRRGDGRARRGSICRGRRCRAAGRSARPAVARPQGRARIAADRHPERHRWHRSVDCGHDCRSTWLHHPPCKARSFRK